MFPTLTKHAAITSALLATLTLSACGKKKDLINPPPATAKTETQNTGGNLGGGLPEQKGDYKTPPVSNGGSKQTPAPTTPPPAKPEEKNPVDSGYKSDDFRNVDKEGLAKRFTGGSTADGLLYTSSSTDELLNYLKARNGKVNAETRRLNLEAAASVVSAKMTIDKMSQDASITLKVQEGPEVKVYNLGGYLADDSKASNLKQLASGNGETSTGYRPLSGTIKCLDQDGGCETTFARLKIGYEGATSIINVVFRNSKADLYFNLPENYSNNPEYIEIREFVHASIKGAAHDNRVKSVTMNSWEVVNGRSGVALVIQARNKELIGFTGPLLAPEAGTKVNVGLSRITKIDEDTLDLINSSDVKLNYANYIGDARLVANNGLGQVKVAVKMRKRGAYAQDQFLITFMRTIKPIVELNDENLK